MHRENYMNALREDIVDTITKHLTPVAQRYGYSDIPLGDQCKMASHGAGYRQLFIR